MRKRHLHSIVLLLVLMYCSGLAIAQGKVIDFSGLILSAETGQPIPQVNLYILRDKTGTSSDSEGRFFLRVRSTDTVLVSSISTQPDTIVFNSETSSKHQVVLSLKNRVYALREVEVLGIGAYDRLKQKLIAMEQRIQSTERPFLEEPRERNLERPAEIPPTLSNPVELLYEIFGSKPRQLRELAQLEEREAYRRALALRFRPEVVRALTGLQGEPLADFMNLCRFSPPFVFGASDYEFYMAILDYYEVHQLRMR